MNNNFLKIFLHFNLHTATWQGLIYHDTITFAYFIKKNNKKQKKPYLQTNENQYAHFLQSVNTSKFLLQELNDEKCSEWRSAVVKYLPWVLLPPFRAVWMRRLKRCPLLRLRLCRLYQAANSSGGYHPDPRTQLR